MPQPILRRRGLQFPSGNPGIDAGHIASSAAPVFSSIASSANHRSLIKSKAGSNFGTMTAGVDGTTGPIVLMGASGLSLFNGYFTSGVTYQNVTLGVIFRTGTSVASISHGISISDDVFAIGFVAGGACSLNKGGVAIINASFSVSANSAYFLAASCTNTVVNFVLVNLQTGVVRSQAVSSATSAIATFNDNIRIGVDASGNQMNCSATMWSTKFTPMNALLQWASDPWSFWYPRNLPDQISTLQVLSAEYPWGVINLGTTSGSGSAVLTVANNAPVGSLVVVGATEFPDDSTPTGGTISDSKSNTWIPRGGGLKLLVDGGGGVQYWDCVITSGKNLVSGVDTITFTASDALNSAYMSAAAFTAQSGTISETTAATPVTGTGSISISLTTQNANDIAVGLFGTDTGGMKNTGVFNAPPILTSQAVGGGNALNPTASSITYAPNWAGGGGYAAFLVSYTFSGIPVGAIPYNPWPQWAPVVAQ